MVVAARLHVARLLAALSAGIVFGFGLALAQMTNPQKIIGFLDVAGNWDPTLAFTMIGALLVATPAFRWVLKRPYPLLDARFSLPSRIDLEPRLIAGAVLFGIGWGLGGLCPGPAIAALTTLAWPVALFVSAMLAGAFVSRRFAAGR